MKVILAIVLTLGFFASASYGLQCFVCNTQRDQACGEPFYEESEAIKNKFLVTCPPSNDGIEPFCRKTKTFFNGETRIHRDCGYLERTGYECYQQRAEDYVTDVCQCNTDRCNSATSFGITSLALIFPLTAAAIL